MKDFFKDFLLLIHELTYLPLPRRIYALKERLPRAMRYLPVLGLICGAAVFFSARLAIVMPYSGAAALLVGINLLAGGAQLLRDLMFVASGLMPWQGQATDKRPFFNMERINSNEEEIARKERQYNTTKAGMTWGLVWLLSLFMLYYSFFRDTTLDSHAFLAASVISRWLMSWLIFYFPAISPGTLHRGLTRRDFIISSILTLLIICLMSRVALYMAFLTAFLGIYLFATARQRSVGALDESCYGAACAWGEVLFLLAWLVFARVF